MTFLRIVIPLSFLFEHDLRANAFRVCREGKPVPTFPDHAHLAIKLTTRPSQVIARGFPAFESWYPALMTTILRLFAWLVAATVTFATLGPPRFRPHSDFGQNG